MRRRAHHGPARRPLRSLPLLLVTLVALAGCTGGGSDGPGGTGGAGGGGAAPAGRSGGTLAVALLDPGPLDPASAQGLEDEVVLGNLFDGLTGIDPSGAVRPGVAASWSSDLGLRRWEFRLRPDARWSDGTPVRSTDFSFAWQRLASPRTTPRPPARALLAEVRGYRSFASGRARSISGLSTPDPATLVVQLDHPFADLPALAAALPLSPLPAEAATADPAAYLTQPVGNGPFRLAAPARPGRPLTLTRNPAYPGTPALLEKVSVHLVPDEQTAWLELQNGRVSFAPVPPDQLAAARTVYGPGLLQGPTLTTWQLTFNLRSKLSRDPRWRQAVSLAVDRDRLATSLAGTAATTLVPAATPDGDGGGASPSCPACAHNPARARALLAKAKPPATPVTLAIPPGPEASGLAALLVKDLAAVGVELQLAPSQSGETPLTLVRGVAPYPRPDPFLARPATASPPARRLLDQARATPDTPARASLYEQAETRALIDLTAAPLVTEHHTAVLAPGPEGFNLTPWNTLDLAVVSLPA